MRIRLVAPLVAAIIGIAGGTVTALVAVDQKAGPEKPTAIEDPLGLGIPMARLECAANSGVVVLGYGDTSPPLRAAIADHPGEDLTYVDVAQSCDTVFAPERLTPPAYAVVLGPFEDLDEPCTYRMSSDDGAGFVTHLRAGNEISVKCVCVLPDTAAPVLTPGMPESSANAVWIRNLQNMFVDVNEDRPEVNNRFDKTSVTGIYDDLTEARVRDYQRRSTVTSEPGVLDASSWGLIRSRLCKNYDY